MERDKEERIYALNETIINKHYFNYEGRELGEQNLKGRWRKHEGTCVVEEKCGSNFWSEIWWRESVLLEGKRRMGEETIVNKHNFNYEGR